MDGYYESDPAVCHACSALQGQQVVYATNFRNTRAPGKPMPAFVPGKTITAPEKQGA